MWLAGTLDRVFLIYTVRLVLNEVSLPLWNPLVLTSIPWISQEEPWNTWSVWWIKPLRSILGPSLNSADDSNVWMFLTIFSFHLLQCCKLLEGTDNDTVILIPRKKWYNYFNRREQHWLKDWGFKYARKQTFARQCEWSGLQNQSLITCLGAK